MQKKERKKESYKPLLDPTVNTRVDTVDRRRTAYIMWEDLPIATITEEFDSAEGDTDWVICPIWDNWEKAKQRGHIVNIAGIDDHLHKDEYIRHYVPSFVTQRTLPNCRRDLYPLLEEIGLKTNDLFEFMCRTHALCGDDDYYVSRTPDKVVDVDQQIVPYDIPDWDTSKYGWTNERHEKYKHIRLGMKDI